MVKDDLMGSGPQRLHAAAFLRLIHHAQDLSFGDHQVFVTGEVHKNGVGKLGTEQRQHADQQIGNRVDGPGCPRRVGGPDDQRAGQPDQDAQAGSHREHLGLIYKADAAEVPHGADDRLVFQAAHAISPEGLDAGYILHDAADILRTDVILFLAVLLHHTERKPQSRNQQQIRHQQNQPGGDIDRHDKHNQHDR